MTMKVCFVGVGSIARRHIRNLHEIDGQIQIDVLRHEKASGSDLPDEVTGDCYYSEGDVPNDYDVIFITNPTAFHYETLARLHDRGKHFFIEKPVFMTGEEDIGALKLRRESVYYVACPLRYTKVLQYVKDNIDIDDVYSIRAISSSYLPEWRTNLDYRKSYSADKNLGGGVELDLIHEWDYLIWLFGKPQRVLSVMGKKSGLEINSNDISLYLADYKDKTLELHLDYFGRGAIRKLQIIGKEDTIEADLIHQKIHYFKSGKALDMGEDRDSYQRKELQAFLEMVQGTRKNENNIENAITAVRIARGIE